MDPIHQLLRLDGSDQILNYCENCEISTFNDFDNEFLPVMTANEKSCIVDGINGVSCCY